MNRPRKLIKRGRNVALPTTRIVKRLREKSDKSQPECVDQPKRHHKSYAVKKILECRLNPERQEMYLVWWEGYPKPTSMGASCWEPRTSFRSCPNLLAEFKASSSPSWQGETTTPPDAGKVSLCTPAIRAVSKDLVTASVAITYYFIKLINFSHLSFN